MSGEREVGQTVVLRRDASLTPIILSAGSSLRQGFIVHNDSTAVLFVKLGTLASMTDFTHRLTSQASLEHRTGRVYKGVVSGVWDAAVGAAQVTELL